jgi:hypothetical protein
MYEVDYEYPVIEEDTILIEANTLDEAERKALERLSDELPMEVTELDIQSIREVGANG